jgi:phage shock protein A
LSSDDLHDARNQLADLNRRLHELEIELRRLENEREELTAAYKEAEAVSVLVHKGNWNDTNRNHSDQDSFASSTDTST